MQTTQLNTSDVYSLTSKATWLRCDMGQIWISHDGKDIVLAKGERYFIESDDLVVIEALIESQFSTQTQSVNTYKKAHEYAELAAAH